MLQVGGALGVAFTASHVAERFWTDWERRHLVKDVVEHDAFCLPERFHGAFRLFNGREQSTFLYLESRPIATGLEHNEPNRDRWCSLSMSGEGYENQTLVPCHFDCEYGRLVRMTDICSVCKECIAMERESKKKEGLVTLTIGCHSKWTPKALKL